MPCSLQVRAWWTAYDQGLLQPHWPNAWHECDTLLPYYTVSRAPDTEIYLFASTAHRGDAKHTDP